MEGLQIFALKRWPAICGKLGTWKFLEREMEVEWIFIGCGPLTVTVTTRIITFLIGNPYNPSFTTVTVRGPYPNYIYIRYESEWMDDFKR